MFKVKDLITGNEKNHMGITSGDALMEVVDATVTADGSQVISVKILGHRMGKAYIGKTYSALNAELFKIAPANIIEELMPKKKEKAKLSLDFTGGLKIKVWSDRIESNFNKERSMIPEIDPKRIAALQTIMLEQKNNPAFDLKKFVKTNENCEVFRDLFDNKALRQACANMLDFFKEFQKEPSIRMINTLTHILNKGGNGREYVANYFRLANDSHALEIQEKIKSPEFQQILNVFALNESSKTVNTRLKIYFGAAGTGKTTKAIEEAKGNCIVCNGAMNPDDLMRTFDFEKGNATFNKSSLRRCMEDGEKIVFDEINLLPFESLRFLQGLVDGKESFLFNDTEIKIHPDFQIIGTMNLSINSMIFGLPEPIVDRCAEIKEFKMTPDLLVDNAF